MRYPRKIVQKLHRRFLDWDSGNRRKLEEMRGIHAGRQCVVLATGPSLAQTDLSLIKGHPFVLGVNGAYKVFKSFKYYFCSCPNFFLPNEDAVRKVPAERLFLSSHVPFSPSRRGPKYAYLKINENQFSIAQAASFETDVRRTLYWGPTVMLDLVFPMALWMGFTSIVLLGADFSLEKYRHFYSEKEHRTIYRARPEPEMRLAHQGFDIVKRYLDARGVDVVNCSPLTDLRAFRVAPLESSALAHFSH